MRIISGSARGTKLISPPGMDTRPMLDRVKQALFNIIMDEVQDAMVLDLFSGSGALGLEALSRGARMCYFVENGKETYKILCQNIAKTGMKDRSKTLYQDAFKIIPLLPGHSFDLFFFDPPYISIDNPVSRRNTLQFFSRLAVQTASDHALLMLHYRKDVMSGVPMPEPLHVRDRRVYGTTELMFIELLTKNRENKEIGIGNCENKEIVGTNCENKETNPVQTLQDIMDKPKPIDSPTILNPENGNNP